MVVFLIVILNIWRPKKSFSSKSYPFSQRCVVQACCHPLIIVFDCENSFHPSRAIQESLQFDSPEPIFSELFIPAFSSRSPNLTGASFKFTLVSSWSLCYLVSKFPSSIFIRFPILPGELCVCYVHFQFLRGSFKISLPSLSYHFIRCFNPTNGSLKTFPSLRDIYFKPFYDNK